MTETQDTLDILHTYILSAPDTVAPSLLDDWAAEVIGAGDYSFETGLLGLGWLIAYLIQEDYMQGDADEVLEDIDDTLYKLTIREVLSPKADIEQLLHYVTFYQLRLQYKSDTHFYRRFAHFECIKLLLDKLNTFLEENVDVLYSEIIKYKINILLKFSYLMKTCITDNLVEKTFYPTIEGLIDFFEKQQDLTDYGDDIAKLYLCVRQYGNPYWEHKLQSLSEDITLGQKRKKAWMLLASPDKWKREYVSNILRENGTDKYLMFAVLTNIKMENK